MKKYFYRLFVFFILVSCSAPQQYNTGRNDYPWLSGRRIFIDPGHGGESGSDPFRVAPNGLTEEEVNLRVSLYLRDRLTNAGALVKMSREIDEIVSLGRRVDMVLEFKPDLFISIHHNGSPRRMDGVNYPLVFVWGNTASRPESSDFASLLLAELERITGKKGLIASDFTVFPEEGSKILRETREYPGVIGEGGFYSDLHYADMLKRHEFNLFEAEGYFMAVSKYFMTGIPAAKVLIKKHGSRSLPGKYRLYRSRVLIVIETDPGAPGAEIDPSSMTASLDGLKIKTMLLKKNSFIADYGPALYPGEHRLSFLFRNKGGRSSIYYTACFSIPAGKGDYAKLRERGLMLVHEISVSDVTEGLKMLLSAYSVSVPDLGSDELAWNIAGAFSRIGDEKMSFYYYSLIREFYPGSKYIQYLSNYDLGEKAVSDYQGRVIRAEYK